MSDIEVSNVAEAALELLLEHLSGWLMQQPEYPVLFLHDRKTRKKAAEELAKFITTIPVRELPEGYVGREARRSFVRMMKQVG